MGNYNPHLPYILGQEWVPIRDENVIFSPSVDFVELGHEFVLTSDTRIRDARFYVNELPANPGFDQTVLFNIYPRGLETATGPIKQVLIPCNNGGITGTNLTFASGTNMAQVLQSPGDFKSLQAAYNAGVQQDASVFFAVNSYPQLANKRILNVSLVYTGYALDQDALGNTIPLIDPDPSTPMTIVWASTNTNNMQAYLKFFSHNLGSLWQLNNTVNQASAQTYTDQLFGTLNLGDINPYWQVPLGIVSGSIVGPVMPWRYVDLQYFEASAGVNRMHVHLTFQIPATGASNLGIIRLEYMALKVTYCEETRVAYGGLTLATSQDENYGVNIVGVRNQTFTADPVLPAGDYIMTLSAVNPGDLNYGSGLNTEFPKLNGLRELYALPAQRGVQINIPAPLDNHLGETFSQVDTRILPQVTLHTSGGPVLPVHAYGRQAIAQVYGSITAAQEILDAGLSAASYPQVRFYARRFGDTTVPLKLTGNSFSGLLLPGTSGAVASTPDNAAIDILGDIDIQVDATLPTAMWFSSTGRTMVSKYDSTVNQRSFRFYIESGFLRLGWSNNGTTVLADSPATVHVPASNGRLAVRVTLDVDNGAGSHVVTFFTAPTIAGPWVQLGAAITTVGTTSIFNSTANMYVGGDGPGGTGSTLTGVIHTVKVLNGIAGPEVANPDFSAQAAGTTSFVDAAGRTWTVVAPAAIISGTSTSSVSITPAAFDDLDEIISGWKEVTLTFPTAPTMGSGTNPQWVWSATGEVPGNRWEVLGAVAPALSGVPGSSYNLAPGINQLSSATYGQPTLGAEIDLAWVPGYAPPVTATTDDPTSDAVLIFSQNPLPITGVSVSTRSQHVVGIGLNCGINPCCIPTDIIYNRITWGLPVNTGVASDSFERTVSNGWGTADLGGAWSAPTAGAASQLSVANGVGRFTPDTSSADRLTVLSNIGIDLDATITLGFEGAVVTNAQAGIALRYADASNYYKLSFLTTASTNVTNIALVKRVAAVNTNLGNVNLPFTVNAGSQVKVRFMVAGSLLKGKIWRLDEDEPLGWLIEVTDTSLTTGSGVAAFARTDAAPLNTSTFDNLVVTPPAYWFRSYELQRKDTVDTTYQTIMQGTSVALTGFNDYEARVGLTSTYRIRGVNIYDFAGPWSSEVSIGIPSPGVSGGCLTGGHVLIFTSNERQAGTINLAYSSVWEGQVQEDFTFAEAGFVQMQAMYNRDFFTAFRPTERGGEQFQRTVLVQAAAISPPTLADFTGLRDMAWEDVSYICVRDEDGNRWFATILVPSGRVTHSRKLYMAPIQVIEVTDTPSEADGVS